jgi:1,4-dihydroxy-2-naphthoate octaprenyltransferase
MQEVRSLIWIVGILLVPLPTRKRSKFWMETQPSTSVELVENVVGLSVTIGKT